MTAEEVALRARIAALLEVSAPKPGNVSRVRDFADATFEDFAVSAVAIGDAMGKAAEAGVGATVRRAVADTRRWVRTNTNLGIILLFAPLAVAARGEHGTLRERLAAVLAGLTVADAEAAYTAIREVGAGGLGTVAEQDVREAPTVTLREAMALAADRDAIAREYVTDYATTFDLAVPELRRARAQLAWPDAVTQTYLTLLASAADTLVVRKRGPDVAERIRREAAAVLAAGPPGSPARDAATERLDRMLREEGNALNPGTTADLVAAAIFVLLLEDGPSAME